jgi:hypothetical protein
MNAPALIDRLARQAPVLAALAEGVADAQARWKPAPEQWSILEVYCHLLDEEREDFRQRLDLTLHRPADDWPPIDPQGWVKSRDYAARDFAATVREWSRERALSLEWLHELRDPDWQSLHTHAKFGSMAAGELLAAWTAHDLLHMRQIVRLWYGYSATLAAPFGLDYAGKW